MHLKRQSVEAWQNEKHYSKENITSENRIPIRDSFKSVDHVKYEGQVRSQPFFLCSFLVELSSCRVTDENCNKSSVFFNLVSGEWMDSRNSSVIESRNLYFTTVQKLFSKIFTRSGKCIMWSSIQVLPNQVSKKSF